MLLSPELSTILLILFALVVGFQAIQIEGLRTRVKSAVNFVQNQNKNAVSLRRMAEVEATLTDLLDSYQSLLTSHKKLRSRIGMREHREKKNAESSGNVGEAPTDEVEKARYKAQLRADMKARGLL